MSVFRGVDCLNYFTIKTCHTDDSQNMFWIKRLSGVWDEIRVYTVCMCVYIYVSDRLQMKVKGRSQGNSSLCSRKQSSRSSIGCPSDGFVVIRSTSNPRPSIHLSLTPCSVFHRPHPPPFLQCFFP